jgi:4-oxalmesaconate hydratase
VSPANCVEELKRCVQELGFVGCVLNPDPSEGYSAPPPPLGSEYWYPLYEALVELDVPALIHSTRCGNEREPYTLHFINEESTAIISLLESRVFLDFPSLKLIVSHGGGAIPYQIGRFRGFYDRPGRRVLDSQEDFDTSLRRLYFDTALYTQKALEVLFEAVGPDRCVFGTERPGTATAMDAKTGRWMDDVRPMIEAIDWLTEADRSRIFQDNAKDLYMLDLAALGPAVAKA